MNNLQLKNTQRNFHKELRDAFFGKKTSLPFIVQQIPSSSLVRKGEIFEALTIGGSIIKKALVKKTTEGVEIVEEHDEKPVSFSSEKDFLSYINNELASNVSTLALNFAYPIKPVFENARPPATSSKQSDSKQVDVAGEVGRGKLDGILLAVTKEGAFHGLIGKRIGKEIENYVLAKRNKRIKVAVANDTVCLLTSGLDRFQKKELAAGIVGTGLNFAFFLDENRLVNLESANFDKFIQSEEGKIIDRQSQQPKEYTFEKETAGAYLYKHFNLIIKERGLKFSPIASTRQLNEISLENISEVSTIARDLLIRSAKLVACQIAGITEFKKRSMVFIMEGSLFWKGNLYKKTVEKTVKQLMPQYTVEFVEIENSAIMGAAKLVS